MDARISHQKTPLPLYGLVKTWRQSSVATVRAGQLAGITTNAGTPYPASDPMYAFVQDYATIDAIFATLMRDDMQQADVLDISYDQTYGFPMDVAITYEQGRLDGGMTVSVRAFAVLP